LNRIWYHAVRNLSKYDAICRRSGYGTVRDLNGYRFNFRCSGSHARQETVVVLVAPQEERQYSEEQSSAVGAAYSVLSNPFARAVYMVRISYSGDQFTQG
jgi:hypothetical protein